MPADIAGSARLRAVMRGMRRLPLLRQLGLLIGLAVSIVLGAFIVLWSLMPAHGVPYLAYAQTGLLENTGSLLSGTTASAGSDLLSRQLQYKHTLEQQLAAKIEGILVPLTGINRVRAQAVAELTFAQADEPLPGHAPDLQAAHTRSRDQQHPQVSESNAVALVPAIRRISVVVLVDNRQTRNAAGEIISQSYTDQELARLAALARDAAGLNAQRGDILNVTNAEFGPMAEPGWLEQPWLRDSAKPALGILFATLVLFAVLRPVMRNLSRVAGHNHAAVEGQQSRLDVQPGLVGERGKRLLRPDAYESELAMLRAMVAQEPKRVAQLVKRWVHEG